MFGIQFETLDELHSVAIRAAGSGRALLVFPGMEGSGESCLQVVAETVQQSGLSSKFRIMLIDYSAESHESIEALVETISCLVQKSLRGESALVWGQSFGNLLGVLTAETGKFQVDHCLMVSPFDSLPDFKIEIEKMSGLLIPAFAYRVMIKLIGQFVFGPCGDQRDHPFFTALKSAPAPTFARRTRWLAKRSFSEAFERARFPASVWLGSKDRLIDRDRQEALFRRLSATSRYKLDIISGSGHVVLPSACVKWLAGEVAQELRTIIGA